MSSENPLQPDPLTHFDIIPIDPGELSLGGVPDVLPVQPPPRKPGMGFWMACLWCLVYLFVSQVIGGSVGILVWVACQVIAGESLAVLLKGDLSGAVQTAIAFSFVFNIGFGLILLRYRVGPRWRSLVAFRLPRARHLMLILAGFPAIMVLTIWMDEGLNQLIPKLKWLDIEPFIISTQTWPWLIAVLLIGVGPGIGEELFCRGYLGRGLTGRYGLTCGILLTSFFFGAMHLVPQQAIGAMLLGAVFHLSYVATRSILIPMLLHILNNSLAILAISSTGNLPLIPSLATSRDANPLGFTFAAIFLLATVVTTLAISRERVMDRSGRPVIDASYGHVKLPPENGALILWSAPVPLWCTAWVIVAASLFGMLWMGL